MIDNPRVPFFDGIAAQWDGWEDLSRLAERHAAGLRAFGVGPREHILDLGCGTGNLALALLGVLGAEGRIAAVDISAQMIAQAEAKIDDPRVSFHQEDATQLSCAAATFDRAICYGVWPHFPDPLAVATALWRVLRPGGQLHIWHLSSRETINAIHAQAGAAVAADLLLPAADTAQPLRQARFEVTTVTEDDSHYLITAVKPTVDR